MAMMAAANSLRQILQVWQLAALGSVREIRRQLVQLGRCGGIAVCLGSLGRALQIRSDLLCDLLILSRVRLLQLLQSAR